MFNNKTINWKRVGEAVEFYKTHGAEYIEVPWAVSRPSTDATLPPGAKVITSSIGDLVGSAEQSFIELMNERRFTRWCVAASPCWRPDREDELHQTYFFKVELFVQTSTIEDAKLSAGILAMRATEFFVGQGAKPQLVVTEAGADLELHGIEIGSYGARQYQDKIWAYGTGLAEPRFSQALARL